jgi:hypothetical protein
MEQGLIRQHTAGHHGHAVDIVSLRSLQNTVAVQTIDVPSNHLGIAFGDLLDTLTPAFWREFQVLGPKLGDHCLNGRKSDRSHDKNLLS